MKLLAAHEFDITRCATELEAFRELLSSRPELDERRHILPFFRKRPHLAAFVASYFPYVTGFDRLAFECNLFGDLVADVVIGDSHSRTYCFVEFESGSRSSVFRKSGGRLPEWSTRFEHGYSQIVDWFWKLSDLSGTSTLQRVFGTDPIRYFGMLVVGRDSGLDAIGRSRLQWRLDRVLVDSQHVYCVTFDQLCSDLEQRMATYEMAAGRGPRRRRRA